jgi:threonine dehydrogenase-like Zn-dependent dehydrogenase
MDKCADFGLPGWGMDGAFAEYVAVPNPLEGITTFKVPDNLSFGEAATVEPVSVACFTVDQADIQPKDTVVVMGAGIIGQGIAQIAKHRGAARVIVCEPSVKRLEMAGKFGADVMINPAETDPIEAVEAATSQDMAQIVFECSGAPAAFNQALRMLSGHGKLMQVAVYENDIAVEPDLMSMMTFNNLTLRGCGGQNWAGAFELVHTGRVRTQDLITQEYPLVNVQEAFEIQADAGASIKVLLKP